jgi:hypothetical protein
MIPLPKSFSYLFESDTALLNWPTLSVSEKAGTVEAVVKSACVQIQITPQQGYRR